QVEGRAKHGDRGSDASWALKSRFEIAIRGGIRTAESVLISVSWSCLLWHSFHYEGHEGARSQRRRKRRTRAFNFPPPRPAFATRCRPTSSPPRNSMKRVANETCVNSVASCGRVGVGGRAALSDLDIRGHAEKHGANPLPRPPPQGVRECVLPVAGPPRPACRATSGRANFESRVNPSRTLERLRDLRFLV